MKNKLTIDLGNITLTDEERKKLLDAVHKAVNSKMKAGAQQEEKKASVKRPPLKAGNALSAGATITATFRNTDPGLSELIATHKGLSKTIIQTDTIEFENVQKGDTIRIVVKTLGKSEITIDRKAQPQEKKTDSNSFRFLFVILE